VSELADAIRAYQRASGGRVTIAWVVLGGINTGRDEVDALRELFAGVPLRLNLIDVNDARPDGYARATESELAAFRDELRTLGIPVVRRYSGGVARHAACGMLAATYTPATHEETDDRVPRALPHVGVSGSSS
jgi:23S rRNA (adenine2503-C2)-methyltransferase